MRLFENRFKLYRKEIHKKADVYKTNTVLPLIISQKSEYKTYN